MAYIENQLMHRVVGLRRLAAKYADQRRKNEEVLANETKKLQELVRNGEGTGDPITDHFLREYGIIDAEFARPLHELEERMKGKTGQLFLVLSRTKTRYTFCRGGSMAMGNYFMGILSDEKIVFTESQYGIPTEAYIDAVHGSGLFPIRKSFLFPRAHGLHAPNTVTIDGESRSEFEVVAGDTEVFGYISGVSWSDSLRRVLGDTTRAFEKEIPKE